MRPRRPERFGRFELTGRLRIGGMAEIFEARVAGGPADERFALKRILPSFTDEAEYVLMFLDESRLALKLSHPNIVRAFEMGQVDDIQYLLLEYVYGVDLGAVLKRACDRSEALDPLLACLIAHEVCLALHHAHELRGDDGAPLQLVHRDVSPQNVLLSASGEVKLIDFGIAKSTEQVKRTQAGFFKGKFGYLSPEQAAGDGLDRRTDLFSLGVWLWEMLTAERLFEGGSDFSTLQRVRKADVPALHDKNPRVPGELGRIVHKLLSRRPRDRFATAAEVAADLAAFAGAALPNADALAAFVREGFGSQLAERFARETDGEPAEEGTGLAAFDSLDPVSAISTMSLLTESLPPPPADAADAADAADVADAAPDAPRVDSIVPGEVTEQLDGPPDEVRADEVRADEVRADEPSEDEERTQDATDQLDELRAAAQPRVASSPQVAPPRAAEPSAVPAHLQGARVNTLPGVGLDWDDDELATQNYDAGDPELANLREAARDLMQGGGGVVAASSPSAAVATSGPSSTTASARAAVHTPAPAAARPAVHVRRNTQPMPLGVGLGPRAAASPAPAVSQQPQQWAAQPSQPAHGRGENTGLLVAALLLVAVAAGMVVMHLQRSAKATVHLTTLPLDAEVRLNGVQVTGSSSPFVLTDLPPDVPIEISVARAGYRGWNSRVTLHPGQLLELPQVSLPSLAGGEPPPSVSVSQTAVPKASAPVPVPAPVPATAPVPAPVPVPATATATVPVPATAPKTSHSTHTTPRPPTAVTASTPKPRAAPSSGATGVLRINSRPWAQIRIDGRAAGNTPQMSLKLAAGKHTVKLTNPEFGLSRTVEVEIVAGQTVTRVVNLAE